MTPKPSSSSNGFFQDAPILDDPYFDDEALQRALKFFLPPSVLTSISPSLSTFASSILSPTLLSSLHNAEHNPPHLIQFTSFGRRQDRLITSPGWQHLQSHGIASGIVSIPYENAHGRYSRIHQFAKYHIWVPASAFVTCPSAMTDGAARLLSKYRHENVVFEDAYRRLTSRDPEVAWTSGQWMTERSGGSDVSGTETIATYDPSSEKANIGPWSVSGFKWFSSATDADMAVLLARTSKGLSLFYAPMREPSSIDSSQSSSHSLPISHLPLNGIQIQRLKSKLGTRALPTAELVLTDMRAHLIGEEGQGIREVATVLNITRLHNVFGAVGGWARGIAISRAYARVRKIKGGKVRLLDTPAHVASLARNALEYRANMMLAFLLAALQGAAENPRPEPNTNTRKNREDISKDDEKKHPIAYLPTNPTQITLLLRILTPLAKAQTAKSGIAGLQESLESLGGLGYIESDSEPQLNVARLYRDANVLSIWEGTTDIMADDVVRVVKGKMGEEVLDALEGWIEGSLEGVEAEGYGIVGRLATEVSVRWQEWKKGVWEVEAEEMKAGGRAWMERLGWIVCAVLLLADAAADRRDGEVDDDGDEVAAEVARRWFDKIGRDDFKTRGNWEEFKMNQRIVEGARFSGQRQAKSRL